LGHGTAEDGKNVALARESGRGDEALAKRLVENTRARIDARKNGK
jgi:hypothetical protein